MWHATLIGKSVGDYRIRRFVAEGAFGAVFSAEEFSARPSGARRLVAVKVIDPQKQQFLPSGPSGIPREIEFALQLRHTGLIHVERAGRIDIRNGLGQRQQTFWYAMELAQYTLESRLKHTGPLSSSELIDFAKNIGKALLFLHGQKPQLIVHRDVKPGNIMFVRDLWKLGDLGLARRETPDVTHTMLAGTPIYLPPEAFFVPLPAPSWDAWAFGMTLLEAGGAQHPFFAAGENAAVYRRMMVDDQPLTLPRLGKPFDEIIRGCLQKDPARRFEMSAVLERLGHKDVCAQPRRGTPNGRPRTEGPWPWSLLNGRFEIDKLWSRISASPAFWYIVPAAAFVSVLLAITFFHRYRATNIPTTQSAAMPQPAGDEMRTIARHGSWDAATARTGRVTTCVVRTRTGNNRFVNLGWSSPGGAMFLSLSNPAWSLPYNTPITLDVVIDGRGVLLRGTGGDTQVTVDRLGDNQRTLVDAFNAGSRMVIHFAGVREEPWSVGLAGSSAAYSALLDCAARVRSAAEEVRR